MKLFIRKLLIGFVLVGLCFLNVSASDKVKPVIKEDDVLDQRILTIDEFIKLAIKNDTEFEQILIDEAALKYQKDLKLPVRDLILSVREDYNIYLNQNRREPETTVSLSKLFPYTGIEIEAAYEVSSSISSTNVSSELSVTISQPIAENAFGKATRLLDKIIGIEVDVARHQIVEAYEDYFASVAVAYYDWYEAYENLKIGEASYELNLKLLDNIKDRQKSNIALPIDVNKITLQLLAKKEKLIELRQIYANSLNFILKSTRLESEGQEIVPIEPALYSDRDIVFESSFKEFQENSRTYNILHLLETKTSFEVEKNANELLPSIDLLIGYSVQGDKYRIKNEDELLFAGVSIEWPFFDQIKKAEYEISKIDHDKAKLLTTNTYYRLYTNIRNLSQQIDREEKLKAIAEEKIVLAQAILDDESENYSFGKVSLNDYIDAVNVLDNNRFNKIFHDTQHKRLIIEWLRILDKIVELKNEHRWGDKPVLK